MNPIVKKVRGGQYCYLRSEFDALQVNHTLEITCGGGIYFLFKGCGLPLLYYSRIDKVYGWNIYSYKWKYKKEKIFWDNIKDLWMPLFNLIEKWKDNGDTFSFYYTTNSRNISFHKRSFIHLYWQRGTIDTNKEQILINHLKGLSHALKKNSGVVVQ